MLATMPLLALATLHVAVGIDAMIAIPILTWYFIKKGPRQNYAALPNFETFEDQVNLDQVNLEASISMTGKKMAPSQLALKVGDVERVENLVVVEM